LSSLFYNFLGKSVASGFFSDVQDLFTIAVAIPADKSSMATAENIRGCPKTSVFGQFP